MEVNRKVFAITKGDYSDYHICTVTMDKDRAEKLKRLFSGKYDEARIEEYTLEETKEDGDLYYVDFEDGESPRISIDEYEGFSCFDYLPYVADWLDSIRVYVRSKDEKHAFKVAQDEYAKWKAMKEGIS